MLCHLSSDPSFCRSAALMLIAFAESLVSKRINITEDAAICFATCSYEILAGFWK